MANENLRKYELMLMFSSTLSDSEFESEIDEVKKHLSSINATVFEEDVWGLRDLAYTIKKEDQAYYVVLYIEAKSPEKLKEFEQNLILNQSVLRYLLLKMDKHHVIKSLEEIEADAEREEAEEAKEKEKRSPKKPAPKPVKKKVAHKKEEKKKEEVDKKLDKLIDDPDIAL